MAPKASFVIGEKLLCFHGPMLYEAKCLNVDTKEKNVRYFVHYSGWNKNWDEWVPECRVLKYNETNLQKQKELNEVHNKSKKPRYAKKDVVVKKDPTKKTETSPTQDKTPKPKPKPAEKKTESLSKTEQKPLPKTEQKQLPKTEQKQLPKTEEPSPEMIEIKEDFDECAKIKIELEDLFEQEEPQMEIEEEIGLPEPLEDWILDDYDLVNNQKKIVHLPARFTVEHILASYVKDKVSGNKLPAPEEKRIIDFANYTRDCFDVLLGKACLYKFEKPQYLDIHKNQSDQRKCEIYGGAHLLRMFCKMDEMLKEANPPGPALSETRKDVQDFIKYLSENMHFFDHRDYEVVPPEYHRRFM